MTGGPEISFVRGQAADAADQAPNQIKPSGRSNDGD
jgi:hypothetical protein